MLMTRVYGHFVAVAISRNSELRYYVGAIVCALLLAGAVPLAEAQETASSSLVHPNNAQPTCDGCPARRVGISFLQVTGINVLYEIPLSIRRCACI